MESRSGLFRVLPLGPPGQPPKNSHRRHSAQDWQNQRTTFESLYVREHRPLREVVEIMERDYGFAATESQYKKKIATWHLDKNVKSDEMETILRKQAKRRLEGKDSDFHVRGQAVEPEKIDRYKRRKNISDSTILSQPSPAAATPSDISCYTPAGGGPSTPAPVSTIPHGAQVLASVSASPAYQEPSNSSRTSLARDDFASFQALPGGRDISNSLSNGIARKNMASVPPSAAHNYPSKSTFVGQTIAASPIPAAPISQEVSSIQPRDYPYESNSSLLNQTTLSAFGYAQSDGELNSTLGIFKKIEGPDTESPSPISTPATSRSEDTGLREKYKSLIRQLPSRRWVDILLTTFFREVNYDYYPLDEAIFRDHLKNWYNLTFSTLNKGPQELTADLQFFPALLFQILALALQFQPPDYDPDLESLKYSASMSLDDVASDYSESGAALLHLLGKRDTTLITVQAGILQTAFLRNCGMVPESWHLLSRTIRDAQEIGLHQDLWGRSHRRTETTSEDALENVWLEQLQRRLWLILSIWDIQMAIALGRPTTIGIYWRGRPILPIDASLPGNRREEAPSPRGERDPPTPLTMLLWMTELVAPLWDISLLQKEPHESGLPKAGKMHNLVNQIEFYCPSFFRADNPDTTFDLLPSCYWLPHARPIFQSTIAFTKMVLHRPFIFTSFSSRTNALKAGLDILRAQRTLFTLLTATHYKMSSLVLNSFDATVLVAAIYILHPNENTEDLEDALQHFEWGMERFSLMSCRNSMARSALGVLKAIHVRLKKALDQSTTAERPLHSTVESTSAVSLTTSPRRRASPSSSSPGQQPVHQQRQSSSINNDTGPLQTRSTILDHPEPALEISPEWEAFSGGMSVPLDFDFSSMPPLQPMHDLLYNDLGTIGDPQMVDLQSAELTAGTLDGSLLSGTDMWQFEGDFGSDSFWGFMNSYLP